MIAKDIKIHYHGQWMFVGTILNGKDDIRYFCLFDVD